MEHKIQIPPTDTSERDQRASTKGQETAADAVQDFYTRVTKRPDVRELLKRLAQK